jgi:hypothetical protein
MEGEKTRDSIGQKKKQPPEEKRRKWPMKRCCAKNVMRCQGLTKQ